MSWNLDLTGKVSLVTGGTRGIGRGIVERLRAAGSAVAYCGTSAKSVAEAQRHFDSLAAGPKVAGFVADVGERDSVEDLFKRVDSAFGRLTVLVNNAGVGVFAPLEQLRVEDWESVIGANLTGAFLCMRAALPRIKAQG